MKKLLTILLLLPVFLFAQQKRPGFIAKYHYLKLSPSMLLLADEPENRNRERGITPALLGTIGAKISRYTAVGLHTGFFNLKGPDNTIFPLGAELTITDFKTKKVFPVITAQWSRTHFKEQYSLRGSRYSQNTYNITGKQMYGVNVGAAVQAFKAKIFITAGYSRLESKTAITSTYIPTGPNVPATYYYRNETDHLSFLVLSLSLVI
jgi:hypothetical protein